MKASRQLEREAFIFLTGLSNRLDCIFELDISRVVLEITYNLLRCSIEMVRLVVRLCPA